MISMFLMVYSRKYIYCEHSPENPDSEVDAKRFNGEMRFCGKQEILGLGLSSDNFSSDTSMAREDSVANFIPV
jgi:hypothetical protein